MFSSLFAVHSLGLVNMSISIQSTPDVGDNPHYYLFLLKASEVGNYLIG